MSKPMCDSHEFCPLWKMKRHRVCHTCALYVHIRGQNPQTGEEMDRWDCSLALMPMLTIENSRQAHMTNASVQSMRNEIIDRADKQLSVAMARTAVVMKALKP